MPAATVEVGSNPRTLSAATPDSATRRSMHNGNALFGGVAVLIKNFQYGGTQRVLLHLANKLHEYGHSVTVLCPGTGPLEATVHDGIRLITLKSGSEFVARLLALRAHPSAARRMLLPLVLPLHPPRGLCSWRHLPVTCARRARTS